jgi:murein DD-endopeptidase MepM/ murein hydrolase activator NlpD
LLTLPWGFGFAPVEDVIAATLIKLIERLQAGPALRLRSEPALSLPKGQAFSPLRAVPTGLPVAGAISQAYRSGHRAMDIAVPVGTPVRATGAGKVLYAGWNNEGYGNLIILENGPYRTYYAHLDRLLVKPGEGIEAGAIVGLSGNTGNSTGPHLHYEVRLNGDQVMPDIA